MQLADLPDLADPDKVRRKAAEQAMDYLRDKFGDGHKKGAQPLMSRNAALASAADWPKLKMRQL